MQEIVFPGELIEECEGGLSIDRSVKKTLSNGSKRYRSMVSVLQLFGYPSIHENNSNYSSEVPR